MMPEKEVRGVLELMTIEGTSAPVVAPATRFTQPLQLSWFIYGPRDVRETSKAGG